jgi:hypothetical protein
VHHSSARRLLLLGVTYLVVNFAVVEFSTVELHLSRLIGMASHLDMKKIQMIGFFFEKRLHWWFEVEKKSTNGSFGLHIYLRTN